MERSSRKVICHIVGARPNFVKLAPVFHALSSNDQVEQLVVHTGQHYDDNMSKLLLSQLDIGEPDINLGIGSGTHAEQTGRVMIALEPVLAEHKPDWLIVYGDVNSTIAAALVASKLNIKIAHVEAGLRSYDWSMPEEINRVLTDRVSDLLLTHSREAEQNLAKEGIPAERIKFVGNVMVDSLVKLLPEATEAARPLIAQHNGRPITLATIHRGALTQNMDRVKDLLESLGRLAELSDVIFPIHPGTSAHIARHGLESLLEPLSTTPPLGYLEFLGIQAAATLIVTDSGGVQEESSFLGIPCLTVRENTERPVTVNQGSNTLIGFDFERLSELGKSIIKRSAGRSSETSPIEGWDGHAGERIADILAPRT
jgi:UDP-N-acetylglucosamine 2-epimerase (non-hydrolysing)